MSVEAYRSLIDQLCEHAGIANSKSMYELAEISVDGCKFMLRHGERSESILIYCDMGELPEKSREAVLLRLMESNLYMFGNWHNPVFSYNPESKRVLMLSASWLGNASGLHTLAFLKHLAGIAKEWCSNYFLDEKEVQSGVLSAGRPASNSNLDRFNAQFGGGTKSPKKK